MPKLAPLFLLLTVSALAADAPRLNLSALAEPLQKLTPADRQVVNETVKQIEDMHHLEALATLTRLTDSNGKNPALRILRAYVYLELGNAAKAIADAKFAESAGGHSAYKCWFLAQVAYATGDKPTCRREIKHVSADPTYGPQAEKLRQSLDAKKKS